MLLSFYLFIFVPFKAHWVALKNEAVVKVVLKGDVELTLLKSSQTRLI